MSLFSLEGREDSLTWQDKINYLKELQKQMDEQFKILEDNKKREKEDIVLWHQFHDVMEACEKRNFLSNKQLGSYIKNVGILLNNEKEEHEVYRYMDVAVYTCMVASARDRIFQVKMETIMKLLSAFVTVNLSSTNYKRYLNVWLDENIIELIESYQGEYPIVHMLEDLMDDNEVFMMDTAIARHRIQKELVEEMNRSILGESDYISSNSVFGENMSLDSVYDYLRTNMERANEWSEECSPIYSDTDFNCLEKIKGLIYLSREMQEMFFESLRNLNASEIGILEKITRMLLLVEIYDGYVDKNSKIVTPNFTSRRK